MTRTTPVLSANAVLRPPRTAYATRVRSGAARWPGSFQVPIARLAVEVAVVSLPVASPTFVNRSI